MKSLIDADEINKDQEQVTVGSQCCVVMNRLQNLYEKFTRTKSMFEILFPALEFGNDSLPNATKGSQVGCYESHPNFRMVWAV